jgi:hypothetical protein
MRCWLCSDDIGQVRPISHLAGAELPADLNISADLFQEVLFAPAASYTMGPCRVFSVIQLIVQT